MTRFTPGGETTSGLGPKSQMAGPSGRCLSKHFLMFQQHVSREISQSPNPKTSPRFRVGTPVGQITKLQSKSELCSKEDSTCKLGVNQLMSTAGGEGKKHYSISYPSSSRSLSPTKATATALMLCSDNLTYKRRRQSRIKKFYIGWKL